MLTVQDLVVLAGAASAMTLSAWRLASKVTAWTAAVHEVSKKLDALGERLTTVERRVDRLALEQEAAQLHLTRQGA